jgi:hypothetical protein
MVSKRNVKTSLLISIHARFHTPLGSLHVKAFINHDFIRQTIKRKNLLNLAALEKHQLGLQKNVQVN